MSDESFTAAGYAIMTEDDLNQKQKLQSKRKTYAPKAFGSKTINPTQTKLSISAKEFLLIYFAIVRTPHVRRHLPSNRVHRQSACRPVLPNKNDTYITLENLRLCFTK